MANIKGHSISWVVFWVAISKQATIRGDDKPVATGKSSPFSHREDAVRWLDAKIREYKTNPEHIAEGVSCKGEVTASDAPALIIRHCNAGVMVLRGERCPNCGTIVDPVV